MLTHYEYSAIANLFIADTGVGKAKIDDGQCYSLSAFALLLMLQGEFGREKLILYLYVLTKLTQILHAIDAFNFDEESKITSCNINFLETLSKIYHKKLKNNSSEVLNCIEELAEIDPTFSMLSLLPGLAIFQFLYFSPHRADGFAELANEEKFKDQDFAKTYRCLTYINKHKKSALHKLFDYKTYTGKKFLSDYDASQQWLIENVKSTFQTVTLEKLVLNRDKLNQFLAWLKVLTKESALNTIQLILSSKNPLSKNCHSATLQYDSDTNKWYVIDSLNIKENDLRKGHDDAAISNIIFKYLGYNDHTLNLMSEFLLDNKFNLNKISIVEFEKYCDSNQKNKSSPNKKKRTFEFAFASEGKPSTNLNTEKPSEKPDEKPSNKPSEKSASKIDAHLPAKKKFKLK